MIDIGNTYIQNDRTTTDNIQHDTHKKANNVKTTAKTFRIRNSTKRHKY